MAVATPIVVTTCNGRRSTIEEEDPKQDWGVRAPILAKHLQKIPHDVICGQELTEEQVHYLLPRLGPSWRYVGGVVHGNVPILYNETKFAPHPGTLTELVLPSGTRDRYATVCQFRSAVSGEYVWISSVHLASSGDSGGDDEALRVKQIKKVLKFCDTLPDGAEFIMGGDFNSPTTKTQVNVGVRKAAAEYDFHSLRAVLSAEEISGESYNSTHEWGKETVKGYRWIDDFLVRPGIEVEKAVLHRTCAAVYKVKQPTDHNTITAWMVI